MVRRFMFISIILREIEEINYLYAVDILRQLSRYQNGMSIDDFYAFFRGRSRLDVWETIMSLSECGLIVKTPINNVNALYFITPKGNEKLQMINACLKI